MSEEFDIVRVINVLIAFELWAQRARSVVERSCERLKTALLVVVAPQGFFVDFCQHIPGVDSVVHVVGKGAGDIGVSWFEPAERQYNVPRLKLELRSQRDYFFRLVASLVTFCGSEMSIVWGWRTLYRGMRSLYPSKLMPSEVIFLVPTK